MGILAMLIEKVASTIDRLTAILPSFGVDPIEFEYSKSTIEQYLGVANVIFPMDHVVMVLGVLSTFSLAMFAYYQIQRLINLMRGAG